MFVCKSETSLHHYIFFLVSFFFLCRWEWGTCSRQVSLICPGSRPTTCHSSWTKDITRLSLRSMRRAPRLQQQRVCYKKFSFHYHRASYFWTVSGVFVPRIFRPLGFFVPNMKMAVMRTFRPRGFFVPRLFAPSDFLSLSSQTWYEYSTGGFFGPSVSKLCCMISWSAWSRWLCIYFLPLMRYSC